MHLSSPIPPPEGRRKNDGPSANPKRPDSSSVYGVIIAFAAIYLAGVLATRGDAEARKIFADLLTPLAGATGSVWSFLGFRRLVKETKGTRRQWQSPTLAAAILSLSVTSFALGSFAWSFLELVLHVSPFPSWADAGYSGSALMLVVGVLMLPTQKLSSLVRIRIGLDSLTVMASLVAFSWFFLLGPTILSGTGTPFAKTLAAFYPALDLVLLLCVMAISARLQSRELNPVRNLLIVGVCAYVTSDAAFCFLNLHSAYASGSLFDLGWLIANLAVGQAARHLWSFQSKEEIVAAAPERPSFLRTFGPYALVPAVGGLLAYVSRTQTDPRLALGVQIGSATLVGLIIVRQAFAIVENARLYHYLQKAYKELEALATTDVMTGLANHRMIQERLRAELADHQALGAPLTLLLIDVDHFKSFNDDFGHPAGDGALRQVADVIRKSVRTTDLPARYGGEEFAAILPNTTAAEAMVVAERIRSTCEETGFEHRSVTLSIGLAQHRGGTASELIEAADRALYAAKHNGRNQTACERDIDRLRVVQGGEAAPRKSSEAA